MRSYIERTIHAYMRVSGTGTLPALVFYADLGLDKNFFVLSKFYLKLDQNR
jgi:hypothetical protein